MDSVRELADFSDRGEVIETLDLLPRTCRVYLIKDGRWRKYRLGDYKSYTLCRTGESPYDDLHVRLTRATYEPKGPDATHLVDENLKTGVITRISLEG